MIALACLTAFAAGRDAPGEVMPKRDWDMTHLDLDVRIDVAARSISGVAAWSATRIDPDATALTLHQVGLDISGVRVDGAAVSDFLVANNLLRIPIASGDEVRVEVDYVGAPRSGLHFRGGANAPRGELLEAWSQGEATDNRHWYPGWDYPNDVFTVRTTVEADPHLLALSNGVLQGTETGEGGWKRWTYHLAQPIVNYLVAVAVGDYRVVTDTTPRVPFEYVVARTESAQTARRSLSMAADQLVFFEDLLDEPYPYDVYRQVLIQRFMYGGMENASLTTLNDGLTLRTEHDATQRTDNVVAHELAHQWFGDLLTCYGWRELWLNEGFATFYAGRWQAHDRGEDHEAWVIRRWNEQALDVTSPMAARAHSKAGTDENAGVYVKGASVLQMLRVHLGEPVFDAAIRQYIDDNRHRLVETSDLRRVLEEHSGEHLGWLFDQWVTGAGVAQIASAHEVADGVLTITITQGGEEPAFHAPVRIEVGLPTGAVERTIWVGAGDTRLILDVDAPPLFVAVDPQAGVLARWDRTQTPAEWAAQATGSTHAPARLEALHRLGDAAPDAGARTALAAILADSARAARFRAEAATALGAMRDPEASDALIAALWDPDFIVRAAGVAALAALPHEGATGAVAALAQRDPVPFVRAEALEALGALDASAAVSMGRRWLGQPDRTPRQSLHRSAAEAIGAHGSLKHLAILIPRIAHHTHGNTLDALGDAAAALATDQDDDHADRAKLARRFEALLQSESLDTRRNAVLWLSQVGDEDSEVALEAFARTADASAAGLTETALAAAKTIRVRDERVATPDNSDLDELRALLEALQERVDDLDVWR